MSNKRNFTLYLAARFISLIGTGVQQIAIPLFILDLTHSGMLMGIFSVFVLVPNLIASPFAGIFGDRKDRKKIMIASDFGRGILICLLALLALRGNMNIYILFLVQIFVSIMDSVFGAASSAIIGELLEENELMRAMSVRGGLDAFSQIVGPAIGGIIYGLLGIKMVFLINGASFIISGILSMFMIYKCKNHENEKITLRTFVSDNIYVVKFISSNRGLMQLFTFAMLSNLLIGPLLDIAIPYVIKNNIKFTSEQYGYLVATITIGMLIGNVVLGVLAKRLRTKFTMNLGLVGETTVLIMLSIVVFPKAIELVGGRSVLLFCIFICIFSAIGMFNAFVNTPISTNLQKLVPNHMRSRFFSLLGMLSQGAIPLGSIMYGILLDKFKYYHVLFIIVILNALVTGIFIIKAVREVYEPTSVCRETA